MTVETILALDTSTLVASVAVAERGVGGARVRAHVESSVQNHSDQLITAIDAALREAEVAPGDVSGVAVGAGPGSFTGLRIGMSTAKGLCFATGARLWTVSSLAALARDARDASGAAIVAPALDARRGEVFFGVFDCRGDEPRPLGLEDVARPADAAAKIADAATRHAGSPAVVVGDGLALYAEALRQGGEIAPALRQTPSAVSVAALAARRDPDPSLASAAPVYVRPSEAERKYPHGNPGGAFTTSGRGERAG